MGFKLHNILFRTLASAGWNSIVPATKLVLITKSDTSDFPDGPCRALWAGEDGSVNLVLIDGSVLTNFPLFAGMNAIGCARVKTGGTLSAALYAVYD